jgi:hypothetical protein
MLRLRTVLILGATAAFGCGGSGNGGGTGTGTMSDMSSGMADGPTIVGEHGTLTDYFSNAPLAGFTITDGQNSTTSDADGNFVLPVELGATLKTTVTGPMYTMLFLPDGTASTTSPDRGYIPIPDVMGLGLEQQILGTDPTKALIQITVLKTGACTSLAGGTLTVNSPAGAQVAYFTTQGLPTGSAFADVDVGRHKPVAVVYNAEPGVDIDVTIHHPTCTQVAPGTTMDGYALTGKATTMPLEPGDNNTSLVFALE